VCVCCYIGYGDLGFSDNINNVLIASEGWDSQASVHKGENFKWNLHKDWRIIIPFLKRDSLFTRLWVYISWNFNNFSRIKQSRRRMGKNWLRFIKALEIGQWDQVLRGKSLGALEKFITVNCKFCILKWFKFMKFYKSLLIY
jgi:hypothetical protein